MAAPLPDWDHFAAVAVEVGKDGRLTAEERLLLGRTAARLRRQFVGRSEMMAMYACNIVRAQAEVLAARAAKRLDALEMFNKVNDGLNRISYRFGKPLPDVPSQGGRRSAPWGQQPPLRPATPKHDEQEAGDVPEDEGEEDNSAA